MHLLATLSFLLTGGEVGEEEEEEKKEEEQEEEEEEEGRKWAAFAWEDLGIR